jgi:hypothetical protein
MWILLYLLLIILVSTVIFLGTLVLVNKDAIFYNKKQPIKDNTQLPKQNKLNVISRSEKLTNTRQRTTPNFVDQSIFTYKPSFESQITKKIYDFLASRTDQNDSWVLYTYNNEKLNGYIHPPLKHLPTTKKLSQYNPENKPMNVILVFKEYNSYIEPITYLKSIENSKYFIPTLNEKHDFTFTSSLGDIDVQLDAKDIVIYDMDDIKFLENADFNRAYIQIENLENFLALHELCNKSNYKIHYNSNTVAYIERDENTNESK